MRRQEEMSGVRGPRPVRQPTAADWAFLIVVVAVGLGAVIGGLARLLSS